MEALNPDEKTLLKDIFVASGVMDDMDEWADEERLTFLELHARLWDIIDKLQLDELAQAYARR